MGWSRASSSTEQNFSASLGVIGGFVGAALSQRLSAHMGERCYQGQPRFGIAQSMRRTCSNISFIQKLPVTGFRAEYVTRSEEQTSELQSLMRRQYDVCCWNK